MKPYCRNLFRNPSIGRLCLSFVAYCTWQPEHSLYWPDLYTISGQYGSYTRTMSLLLRMLLLFFFSCGAFYLLFCLLSCVHTSINIFSVPYSFLQTSLFSYNLSVTGNFLQIAVAWHAPIHRVIRWRFLIGLRNKRPAVMYIFALGTCHYSQYVLTR